MAWSATVYALPTMPGWLLFRFYCESSAFLDAESGAEGHGLAFDGQRAAAFDRRPFEIDVLVAFQFCCPPVFHFKKLGGGYAVYCPDSTA